MQSGNKVAGKSRGTTDRTKKNRYLQDTPTQFSRKVIL